MKIYKIGKKNQKKRKKGLIKIFKSFNRKTATFEEMTKFANLWWEYVAGAGSKG